MKDKAICNTGPLIALSLSAGSGLQIEPTTLNRDAKRRLSEKTFLIEAIAKLTAKTATTERGPPKGAENGMFCDGSDQAPSRPQEFCNWLNSVVQSARSNQQRTVWR